MVMNAVIMVGLSLPLIRQFQRLAADDVVRSFLFVDLNDYVSITSCFDSYGIAGYCNVVKPSGRGQDADRNCFVSDNEGFAALV